jgi:hypothetical protein
MLLGGSHPITMLLLRDPRGDLVTEHGSYLPSDLKYHQIWQLVPSTW